MFTLHQIAVGGFCGVYAGCMALSVNLMRLPYARGAYIGAVFGSLAQLMVAFIDVALIAFIGNAFDDPLIHGPWTTAVIVGAIVVIQLMSAIGCTIMGKYFFTPSGADRPFEREKLLEHLAARDTGKTSVLHDVVLKLQNEPARADIRFSSGWILLGAVLSIGSICVWIEILKDAALDALFYGVQMNFEWYAILFGRFLIVLAVLILINLSVLWILGSDGRKSQ